MNWNEIIQEKEQKEEKESGSVAIRSEVKKKEKAGG